MSENPYPFRFDDDPPAQPIPDQRDNAPKYLATEDEPAVVLVSDEDAAPKIHPLFLTPPSESLHKTSKLISNKKKFSISAFIHKTSLELIEKQGLIDQGCYHKKGPGRKRANPNRTSSELFTLLWSHMDTKLRRTCTKKLNRTDALTTEFIRFCEKLPYFLVLNCSSLSVYKKSTPTSFLYSFLESFTSFSSSLNCSDLDIVRSLAEYSMIFFPRNKCLQIIKLLKEENYEESFCQNLKELLDLRECTSKKSIKEFSQKSPILRRIFSLALEILKQDSFPKNLSSSCLIK